MIPQAGGVTNSSSFPEKAQGAYSANFYTKSRDTFPHFPHLTVKDGFE
jgi:hypothetical protein